MCQPYIESATALSDYILGKASVLSVFWRINSREVVLYQNSILRHPVCSEKHIQHCRQSLFTNLNHCLIESQINRLLHCCHYM